MKIWVSVSWVISTLDEVKHRGKRGKIFEDSERQALLNEDYCKSQQELIHLLVVTRKATSKCR